MKNREQVVKAMKVEQESKPNANTKNCYRGSSTQLYFPAFPRRITNYFHYHKDVTNTPEYPTPQSQYKQSLSSQKTTNSLLKILFPYKRSLENNE